MIQTKSWGRCNCLYGASDHFCNIGKEGTKRNQFSAFNCLWKRVHRSQKYGWKGTSESLQSNLHLKQDPHQHHISTGTVSWGSGRSGNRELTASLRSLLQCCSAPQVEVFLAPSDPLSQLLSELQHSLLHLFISSPLNFFIYYDSYWATGWLKMADTMTVCMHQSPCLNKQKHYFQTWLITT